MPKVSLRLEAAKAKDAEILAKLNKVQQAAQGSKQQTKLNQQRLEWIETGRKLSTEARRLEEDLGDFAVQLGLVSGPSSPSEDADKDLGDQNAADVWFQVSGVRQLLRQVKQRDAKRLRQAPTQALELQGVLGSVAVAISSFGDRLNAQVADLEQECSSVRRPLRRELATDGLWSVERAAEDRCALSDEEDGLLERMGDGDEQTTYEEELRSLNEQVTTELAELEREVSELRHRRADWDEEAQFRFNCIKRQFQGRGREMLVDRLQLEFPHLTREQIQAHEAHCDSLRFVSQRQNAAFRQWRRERLSLLRKHECDFVERQRASEMMAARRQDMLEQRGRQKHLHSKLEVERARASSERIRRLRTEEEEKARRRSQEEARDVAHRKHVQALKKLCNKHAEEKRGKQVQREEEAAAQARREAEKQAQQQERNAERVRIRRQMDDLKQREVAQQRLAAEQDRREREHRLRQAMEKLQVEAPRDPERLLRVPSRLNADAYVDPLVCVTRGPHAGFDEKRLMSDARYKLSSALQAAGLYGTQAGHEVLSSVAPPRAPNPSLVSQVFGGYPE
mmetsp:Transcript_70233/g.121660  ORF Transcript_70233/g.121660 Transcript_70233/m.121660 type:complete len:566 (-) Transcript_70233:94-1791(-)